MGKKWTYTDELIWPAEWVFPGHPDKLCDAIADSFVSLLAHENPAGHCAVEVAIHRDTVYWTGRWGGHSSEPFLGSLLALTDYQDFGKRDVCPDVVREVISDAGYGSFGDHQRSRAHSNLWKPFAKDFKIEGNPCIDILFDGEAETRHLSDDQAIITGYAINIPGTKFMPPEHWFARELALSLYQEVSTPLNLCPDGKLLICLRQTPGGSGALGSHWELDSVSASLLAPDSVSDVQLRRVLLSHLEATLLKAHTAFGCSQRLPASDKIILNGSGNYAIGGPEGDNGLSGKKLLLDYYGPRVPIGGGALCGKDFNKPDRAGAIKARDFALQLIQEEGLDEACVTTTVVPGGEHLQVESIRTPHGWLADARGLGGVADLCLANVDTERYLLNLREQSRWGYWYDIKTEGV